MSTLVMQPAAGSAAVHFVGDQIRFELSGAGVDDDSAWVRTTIGCDDLLRERAYAPLKDDRGSAVLNPWRDVPMHRDGDRWVAHFTLTEPGHFAGKCFVRRGGTLHWVPGDDATLSVHPAWLRDGNGIYCAFTRCFGPQRVHADLSTDPPEAQRLDRQGYHVIPQGGTFRHLKAQLDHIIGRLGFRILHLLPVNPVPTTYARFGRTGSPYAAQDLFAVDPSLVEFDRHSTGLDQFRELTDAAHRREARVIIDLAINHTGWGSKLHEMHPEWFLRSENGRFVSPGAWGITWGDLVELDHHHPDLWHELIDVFLFWCEHGVDGFRCDAGYMVPLPVWQAITAAVRELYPDTLFLLEGLGGPWQATADLLTSGGMQWAYSELFQNYSSQEIHHYHRHSARASSELGTMVHFSETHDNPRLAVKGATWSRMRNGICALLSQRGAWAITSGVEWLARERIDVHRITGLNWGAQDNLVDWIATLNGLLLHHPCFADGADMRCWSKESDPIVIVERQQDEEHVLILINSDSERCHPLRLPKELARRWTGVCHDLLDEEQSYRLATDLTELPAGAVLCLASERRQHNGDAARHRRARHAMLVSLLAQRIAPEHIGPHDPAAWSLALERDPLATVAALWTADPDDLRDQADTIPTHPPRYRPIVTWQRQDDRRILPVPHEHCLLIADPLPFTVSIDDQDGPRTLRSVATDLGHIAVTHPLATGTATIRMTPLSSGISGRRQTVAGHVISLPAQGRVDSPIDHHDVETCILLGNDRGGMAHIPADFTCVTSQYDAILACNEHPEWPVDRTVVVKRMRCWAVCDGHSTPLDGDHLVDLLPGPPGRWVFRVAAGRDRSFRIVARATMPPGRNAIHWHFSAIDPPDAGVELILRPDVEDRNFHRARAGFLDPIRFRHQADGFDLERPGRCPLRVRSDTGRWQEEYETIDDIAHPRDHRRKLGDHGDATSPGWFRLPLANGASVVFDCDEGEPVTATPPVDRDRDRDFATTLDAGLDAYVVRRDEGRTVIAGYPWFLDWGRDTLICARGLISAGRIDEVLGIIATFARFVSGGTLPNCIHGADASNRDTSDAPLWFVLVLEELQRLVPDLLDHAVAGGGRTIAEALHGLLSGLLTGTDNGLHIDPTSGLLFSPSHFTWMDTNHPAGTPRAGYPVEIQALWWRALRYAHHAGLPAPSHGSWQDLADAVQTAMHRCFAPQGAPWILDCIHAEPHTPVAEGRRDDALRCNATLAISLGAFTPEDSRPTIDACIAHLLVPGAIRSLAPLPVGCALPVRNTSGQLLNDPNRPYWGRYEGDEDSRRKPAYHNGTAWTWPFPAFCEALVHAYERDPRAIAAARSWLGSMAPLLSAGCIDHLPEICNGDAPHEQRGCDAQAWGITEALRVERWLASLA